MPICIITTNIKKFLETLEARGKTAYIISIYDTVEFAYNGTSGGFLKPAVIAEFTL